MKKKQLMMTLTATALLATTNIPAFIAAPMDSSMNRGVAHAAETGKGIISGTAWFENVGKTELERNSFQRDQDLLIMGLSVELKDGALGRTIQTVNTDGQGHYAFTDLPDADYLVSFHNPLIWSPIIKDFPGTTPDTASQGPTDVRIKIVNGQMVGYTQINQGFYNASGATLNDGKPPVLNELGDITGTVNEPIPKVPVVSTDNTTTTITVEGLPPGMTFDPNVHQTTTPSGEISITGEISGTPTQVGTFPAVIVATDIYGNKTTENINIIIKDVPNQKPILTVNDTTVPYGQPFDLLSIATVTDPNGDEVKLTTNPKTIDTKKPGKVSVTYTASDGKEEVTKTVVITVGEKPNEAPVLDVKDTPVPYGSDFDVLSIAKATDADGDKVTITADPETIDTKKPGKVSVTYTATDEHNATTSKTVILTVGEKPNGNPVLTVSDVYVDYGADFDPLSMATATDEDGDLITVTSNPSKIDTTKPGTTEITFTADDGRGGVVTEKAKVTVNPKPNEAPLLEVRDTEVPYGSDFDVLSIAKATDADGDKVTITADPETIDTKKPGKVSVTYKATDGKEEVTETVVITVGEKPNALPILTVEDMQVEYGSDFNPLSMAKVIDEDGDEVKITSNPSKIDTTKPGTTEITFTADDGRGGVVTEKAKVTVGEKPNGEPSLKVPENYTVLEGEKPDYLKDVVATDPDEGDIIDKVKIDDSKVDYNIPGEYEVIISVEDQAGASKSEKAKVIVKKNQEPRIFVYDQYIVEGQSYDPMKNVRAWDHEDGDLTKEVKLVSGEVDSKKPSKYALVYSVEDRLKKQATVQIFVTVGEDWSDEISGLYDITDRLGDRIDTLQGLYDDLKNKVDANTNDIKALNEQIKVLKDDIVKMQGEIKELIKNYEDLKNNHDVMKESVEAIKNQIDSIKEEINRLNEQHDALEDQFDKMTQDIAGIKDDVKAIKDNMAETNKVIEQLKEQMKTIEEKLKVLEEKAAENKSKIIINNNNTNTNSNTNSSDKHSDSKDGKDDVIVGNEEDKGDDSSEEIRKPDDASNAQKDDATPKNEEKSGNMTETNNANTGENKNTEQSNIRKPDKANNSILPSTGQKSLDYLTYGGVMLLAITGAAYLIYRRRMKSE